VKIKKNKIAPILLIILLMVIFGIGLFFFISITQSTAGVIEGKPGKIIQIRADLYDKFGDPLKDTKQTIVGSQTGVFFITFSVIGQNDGNVNFEQIRLVSTTQDLHDDFPDAIGTPSPFLDLKPNQGRVLFTTENPTCNVDTDCDNIGGDVDEVCVGSTKTCKIPIHQIVGGDNNYEGIINFGANIEADSRDANGNIITISDLSAVAINFQLEDVIFRTNACKVTGCATGSGIQEYNDISTWIVADGGLGFTSYETPVSTTETCTNADFITYSPDNRIVYECPTSNICVSQISQPGGACATNPSLLSWRYTLGGIGVTAVAPTQPYTSTACNEDTPCQESYILEVISSCTDLIKNGGETDVDCGGPSCPTCVDGNICLLNRDCQSGSCTGGFCQATTTFNFEIDCGNGIDDDGDLLTDLDDTDCPHILPNTPMYGGSVVATSDRLTSLTIEDANLLNHNINLPIIYAIEVTPTLPGGIRVRRVDITWEYSVNSNTAWNPLINNPANQVFLTPSADNDATPFQNGDEVTPAERLTFQTIPGDNGCNSGGLYTDPGERLFEHESAGTITIEGRVDIGECSETQASIGFNTGSLVSGDVIQFRILAGAEIIPGISKVHVI